jgi:hypothetical protein
MNIYAKDPKGKYINLLNWFVYSDAINIKSIEESFKSSYQQINFTFIDSLFPVFNRAVFHFKNFLTNTSKTNFSEK